MVPGYGIEIWPYLIGPLVALLFVVPTIIIIQLIVRRTTGRITKDILDSRKTALDILKERYAKGEINKEEFEEKKKDLS